MIAFLVKPFYLLPGQTIIRGMRSHGDEGNEKGGEVKSRDDRIPVREKGRHFPVYIRTGDDDVPPAPYGAGPPPQG